MSKEINQELLAFLKKSPSNFHAIEELRSLLLENEFIEVQEMESWNLFKGKKYFTVRNGSSIIAFTLGEQLDSYHFQVSASHSDSPNYKVKEKAEVHGQGGYVQLNTESYGGMLASTWLDRPLSLAGRVLIKEGNSITSKLLNIDKDLLIIPNVAIHMNREANNGMPYNNQVDMLPLFSTGECKEGDYYAMLAKAVGVSREQIYGTDISLYNRMQPILWGAKDEFISSPKLDNLQCAFASLKGFIQAENPHAINVYACFDNEEVGSATKQGAGSTFLYDVLQRINSSLGYTSDEYYSAIAKSFMVSCDNAHAVHPNHPEKTDKQNCTYMNKGIVVKYSANQKYTTDGVSSAIFADLCKASDVPFQPFANRSDVIGGSTLGNISSTKVSMNSVDVGLSQLAMHSSYETAGSKDTAYLVKVLTTFYNANILIKNNHQIEVVYR